jgi:hypothetical protein
LNHCASAAEREAHEFNTMSELAKAVAKLICLVQVKTGEDGKMFGSVTTGTIADQLKHQFDISLDKRKIHLEHPIRALGDHEVELRLHQEVTATLKVKVESITPPPAVAPAAEGKREDRPGRRGHRGDIYGPGAHAAALQKADTEERKPRAPRTERPPKSDKSDKPDKPAKAEKAPKSEKAPPSGKAEKSE